MIRWRRNLSAASGWKRLRRELGQLIRRRAQSRPSTPSDLRQSERVAQLEHTLARPALDPEDVGRRHPLGDGTVDQPA